MPFKIRTIWKPTSFRPFKIQTSPEFRSWLCNIFQVVKQLNMAVILKGRDGPVYEKDELKNFCLVAVIGSRERCLRDDFRPLNLQNPWKSGKLFVRMKNDLLAAFERTSIEASNSSCQDTASNTTTTTTLLWKLIGLGQSAETRVPKFVSPIFIRQGSFGTMDQLEINGEPKMVTLH